MFSIKTYTLYLHNKLYISYISDELAPALYNKTIIKAQAYYVVFYYNFIEGASILRSI